MTPLRHWPQQLLAMIASSKSTNNSKHQHFYLYLHCTYSTVQKFRVTMIFFQDVFNWSKGTVKPCIVLQRICIMVFSKILSSTTVFNIDNNKKCQTPKCYIRMISEGSCDTEDWIWVMILKIQLCITGINYILKYFTIENILTVIYFKL